MKPLFALSLAALVSGHMDIARAADVPSADEYGIAEFNVTGAEKTEDQRFGGWPNNRYFNNDTMCIGVVKLFDKLIDLESAAYKGFVVYTKVKLYEIDMADHAFNLTPYLVREVSPTFWRALPGLYPSYCRSHPRDTMEQATSSIRKVLKMMISSGQITRDHP